MESERERGREEPDDASGRQQKEESKSPRQNRRNTTWNSKSLIQQIQDSQFSRDSLRCHQLCTVKTKDDPLVTTEEIL